MDGVAATKRIDAGIKRGKRQMRQEAREQPRSASGTFLNTLPLEIRKQIILDAPERILRGESTTQIAQSYNIPPSTLRSWLIGSEQAEQARGAMLAYELAAKIEEIDSSVDPLALARAREGFRAWSWIAERRESRLYGQRSEVRVEVDHRLVVDSALTDRMLELAKRIRGPVNPSSIQDQSQVIDIPHDVSVQVEDKADP